MTELAKDEAIRFVRAAGFTPQISDCGHTGCQDHMGNGEPIIHTYMGSFGTDWFVAEAVEAIAEATAVHWVDHLLDHDLAVVRPDGRTVFLAVCKPRATDA